MWFGKGRGVFPNISKTVKSIKIWTNFIEFYTRNNKSILPFFNFKLFVCPEFFVKFTNINAFLQFLFTIQFSVICKNKDIDLILYSQNQKEMIE